MLGHSMRPHVKRVTMLEVRKDPMSVEEYSKLAIHRNMAIIALCTSVHSMRRIANVYGTAKMKTRVYDEMDERFDLGVENFVTTVDRI